VKEQHKEQGMIPEKHFLNEPIMISSDNFAFICNTFVSIFLIFYSDIIRIYQNIYQNMNDIKIEVYFVEIEVLNIYI